MKLTIVRIVAILFLVMIATIAAWRALETVLPGAVVGHPFFSLLRGVTTGILMCSVTAWLMLRYRKRYEDELLRQSEDCLRTRIFFENIVQDAGEAIISLDNEGLIRTWNRAAERIYGYRAAEIVGRHFSILVPPDQLDSKEPERLETEIHEKGFIRNYETRRVRKDGSAILVRITRSLLRDSEGKTIGTSAIVSDITSEAAMEARLIQAEKLAAIGQAAASTAHEVRNALAGIWGTIQILERSPAWRELPADVGAEVHLQIARIGHIIDDLLAYARPSRLARQDTDIHEVLERALAAAAASPDAADRLTVRRYCTGPLQAEVDPLQLEQAFQNLILNAYQAMAPRGILHVETARSGDTVQVRFRDTGTGMSTEMLSQALEPFFTTKARGTGLGLAIVKTIVEAHRGTVDLASSPQVGTTVTVTIPRMAVSAEEGLQASAA
jgi:two-component system sensor histidine kinase AtoS